LPSICPPCALPLRHAVGQSLQPFLSRFGTHGWQQLATVGNGAG